MKEYLEAAAKDVFGELYPISKPDFISQVTEASKNYPVIVFLYKSGLQASQLMHNTLQIVASRHKSSKFTAIESTQCIPNYPDRNVPTLLLYREGELVHQIVGLDTLGGMRMSLKSLENSLVKWKMIETKPFNDNDDDNDEDDDDDDQSRFQSRKKAIIY
jgi:thioredoxin-like negative regulator of GroEL